jgi:hypothetical protein
MIGKSNWVCGKCGQGFTRKYSASRHIGNLHFGNAGIFRPFEYIVARINGQVTPSDPLFFRNKKIQWNQNNKMNPATSVIAKDEISYNVDCQNPIQQRWNDNFYQRPHQQDSYSPIAVPPKIARNYSWEQNIESMSKLNEFKIMLSKYCSPQDTWQLSSMASYLLSRGNDDFIDEWLSLLRKKTEMDHSVASWQR